MQNQKLVTFLKYAALTGNFIIILWATLNAVKEGFSGTLPEKVSYIVLLGLLVINSYFLLSKWATRQVLQ